MLRKLMDFLKLLHQKSIGNEMIRKWVIQSNSLKNVSWTFMAKIVAMLFAVMLDILLARLLGIEAYAEWTFFYTTVSIMFYLAWFGINQSVKVFVSKQTTIQDRNVCICSGLILRTIVSLIFATIIIVYSEKIAVIFGYPEKYSHLLFLYKFAGALVICSCFTEFFKELCIGLQKYKSLFGITLTEFGTNFIFGLAGAYLLKNVIGVALGYLISGIILLIVGFSQLNSVQYRSKDMKSNFHKMMGKIFKYALPLAVTGISGMILTEMDIFMLGIISTKQQVSIYSIAKQLCSKAAHLNYALATGTLTSFAVINTANRENKKTELKRLSNLNLLITGIVVIAFVVTGPFLIRILYGDDYRFAGNVVIWLMPYYILYSISTFFSIFLDFQGKASVRSICYSSVLVINFILNWILIPKYGAVGACIATGVSLVPYVLTVVFITVRIMTGKMQVNI